MYIITHTDFSFWYNITHLKCYFVILYISFILNIYSNFKPCASGNSVE